MKIQDSRFKIQSSKFKIQDSRFKIQDSRFKIQDSRFKIEDSRFKIEDSRFKIQDLRFKMIMPTINQFEDLEIWKLARIQSQEIFFETEQEKFSKDWELRNQIRRSAGSVMDNIAEGFERSGNKEFINFLLIAKGSNGEVRSQLYRALDRGHLTHEQFQSLKAKTLNISKQITGLIKYLKDSDSKGFRYK